MPERGRIDRVRERLRAARESVRHADAEDSASPRERSGIGLLRDGAAALVRLLRRAAALLAAAAAAAADAARQGGPVIADAWLAAPLWARQALGAAAGGVAIILIFALLIIPNAPCAFPGGDSCPPEDDAIEMVPADANGYLHANLDADTDQYSELAEIGGRFGTFRDQALGFVSALAGRRIDFEREIRPWSGGEVAAALDGVAPEQPLLLFEAEREDGALEFAEKVLKAPVAEREVEGVAVRVDKRGTAAAIAGGFLLLGPEPQVADSVALAGGGESLADVDAVSELLGELPDHRVAEAYLGEDLVRFLASQRRLGPFNTFINGEASSGTAIALSAEEGGLGLAARSRQDAERAMRTPDFFAAFPPFEPELPGQIGADALAYLGVGDPAASAATLLGQASSFSPALFGGLESFNKRLRRRDGIDIEESLLPLLTGEAALTVEPEIVPGEEAAPDDELFPSQAGVPYLALLAEGVDGEAAMAALAELQGPVAAAVDPGAGQAPVFETSEIAGVDAYSLRLSPVVDLTYAAFDDRLVLGTSPLAVERARADADPLADQEAFERLTEGFEDEPSLLLFLDLGALVLLGERAFLADDPSYARLAPDVRLLEAAALAVRSADGLLATDLRIEVGEPVDPIDAPAPAIEVAPE